MNALPADALRTIFTNFSFGFGLQVRLVCKRWRDLVSSMPTALVLRHADTERLTSLASAFSGVEKIKLIWNRTRLVDEGLIGPLSSFSRLASLSIRHFRSRLDEDLLRQVCT